MNQTSVIVVCIALITIVLILVCGATGLTLIVTLMLTRRGRRDEHVGSRPDVSPMSASNSTSSPHMASDAPSAPPIAQMLGLHPTIAFTVVIIDVMLTALDVTGIGLVGSCAVAAVLGYVCYLMQKSSYGDTHDVALAKGLIVGVLTAIPFPLMSVVTAAGGVVGLAGKLLGCGTNHGDGEG